MPSWKHKNDKIGYQGSPSPLVLTGSFKKINAKGPASDAYLTLPGFNAMSLLHNCIIEGRWKEKLISNRGLRYLVIKSGLAGLD